MAEIQIFRLYLAEVSLISVLRSFRIARAYICCARGQHSADACTALSKLCSLLVVAMCHFGEADVYFMFSTGR